LISNFNLVLEVINVSNNGINIKLIEQQKYLINFYIQKMQKKNILF